MPCVPVWVGVLPSVLSRALRASLGGGGEGGAAALLGRVRLHAATGRACASRLWPSQLRGRWRWGGGAESASGVGRAAALLLPLHREELVGAGRPLVEATPKESLWPVVLQEV